MFFDGFLVIFHIWDHVICKWNRLPSSCLRSISFPSVILPNHVDKHVREDGKWMWSEWICSSCSFYLMCVSWGFRGRPFISFEELPSVPSWSSVFIMKRSYILSEAFFLDLLKWSRGLSCLLLKRSITFTDFGTLNHLGDDSHLDMVISHSVCHYFLKNFLSIFIRHTALVSLWDFHVVLPSGQY